MNAELWTSRECAGYRRCSIRKLDRERAEGRGPAYVRIDGRIFYRRADVERFIDAHLCGDNRNERLASSAAPQRSGGGRPREHGGQAI
jgi:(2Fe-2S) ferredoxin